MSRTAVIVCRDPAEVALRALDLIVAQLSAGLSQRGEAHIALTGGSSASHLFRALREEERARRVDWGLVHVWQGDERFVPTDDPDSNWGMARREWLDVSPGPGVPADHRHPVPTDEAILLGEGPGWAARRYANDLDRLLPRRDGLPSFDVVLLGVGGDGHILSAFPGSGVLHAGAALVEGVPAPEHIGPHRPRVTLSPAILPAARLVIVMVPGEAKGATVRAIFEPDRDSQQLPARLALRPNAVWLLDTACAQAAGAAGVGRPG